MNKSIVRCRCGHQVLAPEVLRTDLYERRVSEGSGREYVYVKFRCRRCKRMGEAFVAENRWDWSILEADHNELSESERDNFLDATPISSEEILDFHRLLETSSFPIELKAASPDDTQAPPSEDPSVVEPNAKALNPKSEEAAPSPNASSSNRGAARSASDAVPPQSDLRPSETRRHPPDDPLTRRS